MSEVSDVITRSRIFKLCVIYIGSKSLRQVSYMELYDFLKKENNISLYKADSLPHSNDLLLVFADLTHFSIKDYYDIKHIGADISPTLKPSVQKQMRDDAINGHRLEVLNLKQDVKDEVYDKYDEEIRIRRSEEDSRRSITIARWSYRIAIVALIITGIQLGADLWDVHIGKDYKFETTTMRSDSSQVIQNQKIIELLEKQNTILESTSKQDSINDK